MPIKITGTLTTTDVNDVYATHDAQYGRGGFRSVQTFTELGQIPIERITTGSWVKVVQTDTLYEWDGTQFVVVVFESASYAISASRANSSEKVDVLSGGSTTGLGLYSGSFYGTSSWATTASFALNAGTGGAGFPFSGAASITGSLIVSSSGITLIGSGLTGSVLGTSSYALNSITSSYSEYAVSASRSVSTEKVDVLSGGSTTGLGIYSGSFFGTASHAITASFALNAASGTGFPFSGNAVITGSLLISSSGLYLSGSGVTGSLLGTSSWAVSSSITTTASFAISSSYALSSSYSVSSSRTVSASRADSSEKVDVLSGGSTTGLGIYSGSFFGTSSWAVSSSQALTASFALNAASGTGFPFSGSAIITGSLLVSGSGINVTGSLNVTQGVTGSLLGTSSWAVSASRATTASFVLPSGLPTGTISSSLQLNSLTNPITGSFTGSLIGSLTGTASRAVSASRADSSEKVDVLSGGSTTGLGIYSGSFFGTSSWAVSASTATTASFALNTTPGFPFTGNAVITGSLLISSSGIILSGSGLTGSVFGTSSWAISASRATTASNATTSSYVLPSGLPVGVLSSSLQLNSLTAPITGSFTGSLVGSLTGTASWAISSSRTISASRADSSEKVDVLSGGSTTGLGIYSGSFFGTSSWAISSSNALTASFALNAASGVGFPFSGSAVITGSLLISGSGLQVTGSTTLRDNLSVNGTSITLGNQTSSATIVRIGSTLGTTPGSVLIFNGTVAGGRYIDYQSGTTSRWRVGANTTAEGGANAGSNYFIQSHDDSGNAIDTPLLIFRAASGSIVFSSTRPITAGTYNSQTISSAANFTGNVTVQSWVSASSYTSSVSNAVGYFGTSSWSVSSSRAITASNAITSSFVLPSGLPTGTISSSLQLNSLTNPITGSFTGSLIGSLTGTASWAVSSSRTISASRADSSEKVDVLSGGSTTGLGIYSGSFFGTASQAITASFALNAASGVGFPFSGSAVITGSLLVSGSGINVTGSLNVTQGVTGSLLGTSSWAVSSSRAITASNATTSSFVLPSGLPIGTVSSSAQQVVTSYTNATDNRILTSVGTGVINGEANLTFDGGLLTVISASRVQRSGDTNQYIQIDEAVSNGVEPAITSFTATNNAKTFIINATTNTTHTQETAGQLALDFRVRNSSYLFISSSGNVGIGNVVPGAKLHVQGNVSASNYTSSLNDAVGYFGTSSWSVSSSRTISASRADSSEKVDVLSGGSTTGLGIYSGSFFGTSSWAVSASNAVTASFALNAGSGTGFPFSGSAVITGSLLISGSGLQVTGSASFRDNLLVNGGTLFADSVNNRVGIGTTSPQQILHVDVSGSTNIPSALFTSYGNASERVGLRFGSSSLAQGRQHNIWHRLSTGNPGATWILNAIAGETAVWSFEPTDNSSFGVSIRTPFNAGTAQIIAGATQSLSLGANNVNNIIFLTGSNRVGIGTTAPGATLHAQGNVSASSYTSSINNAVGYFGTSSWAQSASRATSVAPNSVALGTDTTGNYVATITQGRGVTVSGGTGEGTTNIVTLGTSSAAYNISGSGNWFTVASRSGSNGRGISEVYVYSAGGDLAPHFIKLLWNMDWGSTAQVRVVGNSGIGVLPISAFRATYTGSTQTAQLEVQSNTNSNATIYSTVIDYANFGGVATTPVVTASINLPTLVQIPNAYFYDGIIHTSASGNVGIGTLSGSARLQIQGNISASSYSSSINNDVGFLGTSSWAVSSSRAMSASRADSSEKVDVLSGGSTTGLGIYSGSFFGTASQAITASFALNAASGTGFPFSGSAVITGSLLVSGSGINVIGTASFNRGIANGNIDLVASSQTKGVLSGILWHDSIALSTNLRYTGSTDPYTAGNWQYIQASGSNNIAGITAFMKGNGNEGGTYFSVLTTPVSPSAGASVTSITERMRVGGDGVLTVNATGIIRTGTGSLTTPAFATHNDTNTGIYFPAADTIGFVEGGVEAMRIDSSGRVGINKTNPAFPLDVSGSVRIESGSLDILHSTSTVLQLRNTVLAADARQWSVRVDTGELSVRATTDANATQTTPLTLYRTGTASFSGNVGIGTTTPSQRLDVSGSVNVRSASPTVFFDRNGAYTWRIANGDGTTYPLSSFNVANNAGTAAITVTSANNVGIGTTVPGTTLHVQGNISASSYTSSINNAVGYFGTASWSVSSSRTISASRADSSEKVDVLSGGSTTGLGIYSGSFFGTSSWATTASFALNASSVAATFPFNGNAVITGSLLISGSGLRVTGSTITSGNILPAVDNLFDLGSSTNRWANLYTGDLNLSNEGSTGNIVDRTTGNWTIQEGEECLYIMNNKSGKRYRFVLEEII